MSQPNSGLSIAGTVALLVIGAVIFIPSGLCTGLFMFGPLISSMMHPGSYNGEAGLGGVALVIGGPFVAVGGIMLWFGVRRVRAHLKARKANTTQIRNF